MHFSRSITLRLKKDSRSKQEPRIVLRASWCGHRVEFTTPYTISPDHWNTKSQRASGVGGDGTPANKINSDLSEWRGYLDEIFNRYEFVEKEPPAPGAVRALFEDMIGRRSLEDFGDELFLSVDAAFGKFIAAHSSGWEQETLVGYNVAHKHAVAVFGDMDVEELTASDIDRFQSFLLKERNARNSYAQRTTTKLKTFLRWCKKMGYYHGDAHDKHTGMLKKVNNKEIVVLTPDELSTIMGATFTSGQAHLERVRDLLVFACFTGLRYSDIQALTTANIRGNAIDVVTQKTADHLVIELNATARGVIDKYKDARQGDKLLPTISNQKANDYLKTLGRLLGIDTPTQVVYYDGRGRQVEVRPKYELMSTHIGRRTFISNALSVGVPVTTVMAWTGHKGLAAMKPYIKLVEAMKRDQMGLLDSFAGGSLEKKDGGK